MSNLDAAFIKAYEKNEATSVSVEKLRGETRREESITDQLPSGGKAPSLSELYGSNSGASGPRPAGEPRKKSKKGSSALGRLAANSADPAPTLTPRIAPHTIIDDEPLRPRAERKAPLSSFRRIEERVARMQIESETQLLEPKIAEFPDDVHAMELVTRRIPEPAPLPAPVVDVPPTPRSWSTPPIAPARPQAAFQIERFDYPSICAELRDKAQGGFNTLCDKLMAGCRDGRNLLCVSGATSRAGATTFVLTLAAQLSSSGLRTAIVDADLASPELAHQLGVLPQYTWHDAVNQNLAIGESWIESTVDPVTLAALVRPIRIFDSLIADRFSALVRQTKDAFDLTLVDVGQFQRADESGVLNAVRAEGLVLVVDARQAAHVSLGAIEQRIMAQGISWWGIAENFAA